MMTDALLLQKRIERHLDAIESIIGPGYKITLICRYEPQDGLDKDVVLTMDNPDRVMATFLKMIKRALWKE